MAVVEKKDFQQVGTGFRIKTKIISLSGLIAVLKTAREGDLNLYRYSKNGGETFTEWDVLDAAAYEHMGIIQEACELVVDLVVSPYSTSYSFRNIEGEAKRPNYNNSVFKTFFESNDVDVLAWSLNVLEKLFEPGILPVYYNEKNQEDFAAYFFTITQFFAFIVIYARKYEVIEKNPILLDKFIQGIGLIYENIQENEMFFLLKNWIQEFKNRGTLKIADKSENKNDEIKSLNGELRRIVGYLFSNEFIFGVLSAQNTGWCLGWSSPTWDGTETVNAVTKAYDFGPMYSNDIYTGRVKFENPEVNIPPSGQVVTNKIFTEYPWKIVKDGEIGEYEISTLSEYNGVKSLEDYPIIGNVERVYDDGIYALKPVGTGRCGISTEIDKTKAVEAYIGLDYEVTVWVKAKGKVQNIEFGLHCYDRDYNLINQARITDFRITNSFFVGERYQSPCKVKDAYYQLKGIIYNIEVDKDPELYLNFQNGRPLRFIGEVRFIAPYIVQDRTNEVDDILIAGITLKPLTLPFSQCYLGQRDIVVLYSQIFSARSKEEIERYTERYLLSYKNKIKCKWLDYVERTTWFLTFNVTSDLDGTGIENAKVTLEGGALSYTDNSGYIRFELPFNKEKIAFTKWKVEYRGVVVTGETTLIKDTTVTVDINIPILVNIDKYRDEWGDVLITGENSWGDGWLRRSKININVIPKEGFELYSSKIEGVFVDIPIEYQLGDKDITLEVIFNPKEGLKFEPDEVILPAEGGIASVKALSYFDWEFDNFDDSWLTVAPTGDKNDDNTYKETDINIESK